MVGNNGLTCICIPFLSIFFFFPFFLLLNHILIIKHVRLYESKIRRKCSGSLNWYISFFLLFNNRWGENLNLRSLDIYILINWAVILTLTNLFLLFFLTIIDSTEFQLLQYSISSPYIYEHLFWSLASKFCIKVNINLKIFIFKFNTKLW